MQIDKGIPVPPKTLSRRAKWPFDDMQVGDSFLLKNKAKFGSLGAARTQYLKTHPEKRFTIRKVSGGVRCWRLPDETKRKPKSMERT